MIKWLASLVVAPLMVVGLIVGVPQSASADGGTLGLTHCTYGAGDVKWVGGDHDAIWSPGYLTCGGGSVVGDFNMRLQYWRPVLRRWQTVHVSRKIIHLSPQYPGANWTNRVSHFCVGSKNRTWRSVVDIYLTHDGISKKAHDYGDPHRVRCT